MLGILLSRVNNIISAKRLFQHKYDVKKQEDNTDLAQHAENTVDIAFVFGDDFMRCTKKVHEHAT